MIMSMELAIVGQAILETFVNKVFCNSQHITISLFAWLFNIYAVGLTFILVCPNGFYGQDCLDECSCINGECHPVTGLCSCFAGYVGAACNTSMFYALF